MQPLPVGRLPHRKPLPVGRVARAVREAERSRSPRRPSPRVAPAVREAGRSRSTPRPSPRVAPAVREAGRSRSTPRPSPRVAPAVREAGRSRSTPRPSPRVAPAVREAEGSPTGVAPAVREAEGSPTGVVPAAWEPEGLPRHVARAVEVLARARRAVQEPPLRPATAIPEPAPRPAMVIPEPDGPPPSRVLLQNIEVNITVWGDSLCTPQHELDHVISAKSFFDPDSMTVGKYHTGFHDDIVTGIFNHPSFEYVLTDLLQFLIAIRSEQPRRRQIYLGIVCTKGRHRSVALAVLFQHVVLFLGAARCSRTFMSDEIGEWRHLCRGCSRCNEYSVAKMELQCCLAQRIASVWQYLH